MAALRIPLPPRYAIMRRWRLYYRHSATLHLRYAAIDTLHMPCRHYTIIAFADTLYAIRQMLADVILTPRYAIIEAIDARHLRHTLDVALAYDLDDYAD